MTIHDLIAEKSVDFECKTGVKPTKIYLGDEEITALLQWAYENQYIGVEPSEADIEGDNRPEVAGLKVYYEKRVIQLENELIELINHCGSIEEPGTVIDSAMQTLMKNKTIERMPESGAYNA